MTTPSVPMHVADIREAGGGDPRSSHVRAGRARERGADRRATERRDQPRAGDRRAVLVEESVLAQAADSEREICEELAAALASPRDARAIADELRG